MGKIVIKPKECYQKTFFQFYQHLLKLTNQEVNILTEIALELHRLKEELGITDNNTVNSLAFSTDTRKYYREKLGLSQQSFNNFFASIVNKGIIKNGKNGHYLKPELYPTKELTIIIQEPDVNTDNTDSTSK